MVNLSILIAGVGGQGVVLASDILGDVALEGGLDVKKTDTLGMAQRGGSVVTHLRMGERVASPLIGEGQADILLAFEKVEAARWTGSLKNGASAIVNDHAIPSLSVSLGTEPYPADDEIVHILRHRATRVILVAGSRQAAELGNSKVLNVFMLGALSMLLPFSSELWQKVITNRLPSKILAINLKAFENGRREMLAMLSEG
jgi:indolepyruvate ferredoxin oxidoreductase beta subunit